MPTIAILANFVLIGAIQGGIMSLFLLSHRNHQQVRTWALAGFLSILAYDNLDTYYIFYLQKSFFIFDALSFTVPHAAGACLYLYASSHWQKEWPQPIWRYFIPFFLMLSIRLSIELEAGISSWQGMPNNTSFYQLYYIAYEPLLILNIGYFMLKIRYEYRRAEIEDDLQEWMRAFILISGIGVIFVFLLLILSWISTNENLLNVVFALGVLLSFWVYWLAFFGYQRTRVIFIEIQRNEQVYWNSLSEAEIETCRNKLNQAFEQDKCYLDSGLGLSKLAQLLQVSPKLISAVLNQKIGMGFNEYLNSFRVEEAKKILLDPAKSHLNITGVAMESGFNSIPTFQRAFKHHTGQTPSEFLKKSMLKS